MPSTAIRWDSGTHCTSETCQICNPAGTNQGGGR